MLVPVPAKFATYIRLRRLIYLIALFAVIGVLQCLFPKVSFVGALPMPLVALTGLIGTFRVPLNYVITENGMFVGTERAIPFGLTGLGGVVPVLWFDLRRDSLIGISLYHWRDSSALQVTTRKNPRGMIFPMSRDDAIQVQTFFGKRVES